MFVSDIDTITSQATPVGQGGIGIIRVSGTRSNIVSLKILKKIPKPRYASFLNFFDINGNIIDKGIALWFPSPNSFTGEDTLELHAHGGQIVLDLIIKNILYIKGIRIAKPGEFSERAFLNGKIDLTQAEAICDLIQATSEHAVRASINSLSGVFSRKVNDLSSIITKLRVFLETEINFVEESGNFISHDFITNKLKNIIYKIQYIQNKSKIGSVLKESFKIIIVGKPNSGKSSLFNSLSLRDSAIVTDIKGTTRDLLREFISLKNGILVELVDTAGFHNTSNYIEKIGIDRTWKEISSSNHILFVVDKSSKDINELELYSDFTKKISHKVNVTLILNKIDKINEIPKIKKHNNFYSISLSVLNNKGVDILLKHLNFITTNNCSFEGSFLARRRHLESIKLAYNKICKAYTYWKKYFNYELLAEDLIISQKFLDEITGKITSDDLLGRIFSKFCIGK
ncbi:tRNA modification GTPase MnmE [Buchnera aphidicola (Neophyllaphis podocarpi)]|uniref:tRNA uridine-5-carboxymethylaminomethyl(34) synthesis GTPase MnmE n=1 Tax=Buchnera aphidicola TaxID=9 RepID=UPI003464873E